MNPKSNLESEGSAYIKKWIDETLAMRGVTRIPARLYRFVSVNSTYFRPALHELFINSRIYLPCREDFNDPFDSRVALDVPSSPEAISEFVSGFSERNPTAEITQYNLNPGGDPEKWRLQAQRGLDKAFDSIGIYSLADSIKNPLMWAHYASAHKGIALMFRHGQKDTFGAYPIRYQNEFPRMTVGIDGIDVFKIMTKGSSWEYEGEWRIVLWEMARQWEALPPNLLCGVVFGAHVSPENYEFVNELVRQRASAKLPPLSLFHARACDSFDLEFYRWTGESWKKTALD